MRTLPQCKKWNENGEYEKVIDLLENIENRLPEWDVELARAYVNYGTKIDREQLQQYCRKALEVLRPYKDHFAEEFSWNFLVGYACFYLGDHEHAGYYFEKAHKANPEDKATSGYCDRCAFLYHIKNSYYYDPLESWEVQLDIRDKMMMHEKSAITVDVYDKGEVAKQNSELTHFGGKPHVPADFIWPRFRGKGHVDQSVKERPLAFIAQFNCKDLVRFDREHLLPDHGLLSFFYEIDSRCTGLDPWEEGCGRVFWFEDISSLNPAEFPVDMNPKFNFPESDIWLYNKDTYPNEPEYKVIYDMKFDDEYLSAFYSTAQELCGDEIEDHSRFLGWPFVYFDSIFYKSMFLACELIQKGYTVKDGFAHIPKEVLQEAEKSCFDNWEMLLQLATVVHDDLDDLFDNDSGKLYFFIRKEDLKACRFDRIWLIRQYK